MIERCYSCEITTTVGLLISDYVDKAERSKVVQKFMKGNMSIRDLQREQDIPESALESFKKEDVKLDMTLKQAVEIDNTKHLTDG